MTIATSIDGISAIVLILIIAFTIDRVVMGVLFLLGLAPRWRSMTMTGTAHAKPLHRLAYYGLAAALAACVVVSSTEIRILKTMLNDQVPDGLDMLVTGLALMGGADRIAALLKERPDLGSEEATPRPIEVTGRLVLDRDDAADSKK